MATIIPDEGLDWARDRLLSDAGTSTEEMLAVAVGDGSTAVSSTDTQLDNELYRATKNDSSVSITSTSNTGEIEAKITVNGGTEVPAGSDLRELAIFAGDPDTFPEDDTQDADDILMYREVRSITTVESGGNVTFTILYDVTEA